VPVKSYITYRRDEDRMHARVPMSAWLDEHVVVHVTVAVGRTGRLVPLSQREPQSSFLSSLFLFSLSFSLTSLHSPLARTHTDNTDQFSPCSFPSSRATSPAHLRVAQPQSQCLAPTASSSSLGGESPLHSSPRSLSLPLYTPCTSPRPRHATSPCPPLRMSSGATSSIVGRW
jgi:hypothetical protein